MPGHSRDDATGKIKNYWYREVLDVMGEKLRELVAEGVVDEEDWNNFVIPAHQRHLCQWQKWFTDNDSMFRLDFLYAEEQTILISEPIEKYIKTRISLLTSICRAFDHGVNKS